MNLSLSTPVSGRHEIIAAADNPGLDEFGGFPKLCPYGGKYSVRLGNKQTGSEAEALSYTFVVPSTIDTFTFTYFYAVVLEDPAHLLPEQPRFFVTAYDVITGDLINCASYDYISTAALPGFFPSPGNPNILYKGWTPTSLQFAGMGGHTVRLEFRTADCTRTGHFGYAYMDIASACSNILATAPYCIETNSLILDAPFGFKNYTWYNSNFTSVVGTGQSMTMSPPPVTTGVFYVDVEPYPGFGCRDTLQAYVKPMPVPDTPDVAITNLCQFQLPVPLTASVASGHQLLWYTSAVGGIPTSTAPMPQTTTIGTSKYWVSQKELFGCEGFRTEMTVHVLPTPAASFNINKLRQCQDGNSFTFTSTSTNLYKPSYTWEFGNGQTYSSTSTSSVYSYPGYGNFTVKLKTTNDSACTTEQTHMVTVVPKPVATFAYPSPLCENVTKVALQDRSYVPGGLGTINKWWWNINGQIVQSQTTPPPSTAPAGPYPVKIAVSTTDGCKSDTNTIILNIRYNPIAAFGYGDLMCNNETIRFTDLSYMPPNDPNREQITKWYWTFDNGATATTQNPAFHFNTGIRKARLISETMAGCKSTPVERSFEIFPKPTIKLDISDSCVFVPVTYTASILSGNVVKWDWNFGNGYIVGPVSTITKITRTHNYEGNYPVTLLGYSDKGCKDTIIRPFKIYDNKSFAGPDTAGPYNEPVQLDAHGERNMLYTWTPSTGLNQWDIEKPIATYDKDQLYKLYTVTEKGCKKNSQVLVKRYAGPELYVPDAFTPNNDGVNDRLKVIPTGIKSFGFLAVYNRWGQLIYRTTNYLEGWDGTFRGEKLSSETFVYVAQATDYKGRPLHRKGTVILLR